MGPELLEIEPQELKFTFELKKQSTCSVQLINNSDQFVAFKVKTTSPKKYCVRPNVGIVQPRSSSDFTVTMQAQRVAPVDMQCRDKFLVQSTIIPFGTSEEDILPSMFSKDNGKYIEENKLRVVLISPPNSPVLQPINGSLKQEPQYEAQILKDQILNRVENFLQHKVVDNKEELKPSKDVQELKPAKEILVLKPATDVQEKVDNMEGLKPDKEIPVLKPATDVQEKVDNAVDMKLAQDVRELRHAKDVLELRLSEDEESRLTKDEDLGLAKGVEKLRVDHDFGEVEPLTDKEELRLPKDVEELRLPKHVEEFRLAEDLEELKPVKDVHELRFAKNVDKLGLATAVKVLKPFNNEAELKLAKDVEELRVAKNVELQLAKDIEKLKLKLNELALKQSEAEVTIARLEEERGTSLKERQTLKEELATLKTKTVVRTLHAGFPYLFVLMVALISVVVGYMLQSVHADFPIQFAITVAIVSVVLGYILRT